MNIPGALTGKGQAGRVIAALVLLTLTAAASSAQEKPHYAELPNFYKVDERIYRGGQPKAGGVKKLADLGTKAIINLRGSDEETRAEELEAGAAGIAYFNIPMPALSRPSEEQVSRVMEILGSEENWPVFIHCKRGSDRTGTIVALYRIMHDEWTATKALSEARGFGLSWVEFGMKDYITDYYRDRQSRQVKPSEQGRLQPVKRSAQ